MKLFTLCAIIGGLLKTMMIIGRLISKPIGRISINKLILNEIFSFEDENDKR